ncbi:MAG TPA: hypothetical protein VK184_18290 [Nostocaceae cyanobacterium]|nr:hypothetical protein [Nostocaceae cyanobacterium]
MLTSTFVKPLTYSLLASLLVALVGYFNIDRSPKESASTELTQTEPITATNKATLVSFSQTTSPLDEKNAQDLVWKLPQVRRKAREIQQLSRGTIRLAAAVDSSPTEDQPYYLVRVFENHPNKSTVTIYWFRVFSPSGEIEALDLVQNQYISLDRWNPDAR